MRGYRFSGQRFSSGIEHHTVDGAEMQVYNPEKTLADCFAYRSTLGMEVVLEALKLYHQRYRADYNRILEYARLCRVEHVMRPYLEASL